MILKLEPHEDGGMLLIPLDAPGLPEWFKTACEVSVTVAAHFKGHRNVLVLSEAPVETEESISLDAIKDYLARTEEGPCE